MEFRIGVNLGDVMLDGEQIYGDGVNVAARHRVFPSIYLGFSARRTWRSSGSVAGVGQRLRSRCKKIALRVRESASRSSTMICRPSGIFNKHKALLSLNGFGRGFRTQLVIHSGEAEPQLPVEPSDTGAM
jgi:hypothetical protein